MSYKILTLAQRDEWNRYFKELPIEQQDVYFTPEYYELYEKNGDGKAQCFIFEKDGEIALYPFLLNSVNELGYKLDKEYFDIQGAYGYNGLISITNNEIFLKEFNNTFLDFCKNKKIIAEFIRFNPVIQNHKFCVYLEPIYTLDNVMIDLSQSEESIWMKSFDNGVRKAVKKGIRNKLKIEFYLGKDLSNVLLDEFISIYYSTMDRQSAEKYYYFNKGFFQNLIILLADSSLFTFVFKDTKIISTELNLFSGKTAYGFLGGTLREGYKFAPNSFLRFELIKKLKHKGIINYSIGGGSSKHDNIYKYKKSFSRYLDSNFYIGKKIHNSEIFNEVIRQWEDRFPEKKEKYSNFLLKYRY